MITSRELHSSSAIPWKVIMPPRVMMNGSTLTREMMKPISVSSTTAVITPAAMEPTTPKCHFEMPRAVTMDTREASMPTERSMPPEIMTSVMPTRDDARDAHLLEDVEEVHRADEGRELARPAMMSWSRTMMTTKATKMAATVRFSCRLKSDSRFVCPVLCSTSGLAHTALSPIE